MASKKKLQIAGVTLEDLDAEELAEPHDPEQFEARLLELDRMVLTLPPVVTAPNGVIIDREAVHRQLQHYIVLHEQVRRAKEDYDDALVRLALSQGKWGLA